MAIHLDVILGETSPEKLQLHISCMIFSFSVFTPQRQLMLTERMNLTDQLIPAEEEEKETDVDEVIPFVDHGQDVKKAKQNNIRYLNLFKIR